MKKLFILMLSSTLLASSIPTQSYAAVTGVATDVVSNATVITKGDLAGSTTEPTNQKLESAIVAVKKLITVPKDYSDFNYYFYNTNSYSDSYWCLTWMNPTTNASIQVNCDANNHIVSYYKYDYDNRSTGIAKYLKSELKKNADEFIAKIAPEVSKSLVYTDAEYQGIYDGSYIYYYQRKNNGVEFSDNDVSVSVNSITGEVSAASINWLYDVTVPSSTVKLTKDEATALIKKNMKMKLVYRTDYYSIFRDGGNTAQKAYLVYEPSLNYISVDAKTGEVYTTRSEYIDVTSASNGSKDATATEDSTAGNSQISLTEEEAAKIEELKNLISKSDAIKKITGNKYLYLDKNLSSYTATLEKNVDSSGNSSYAWFVSLSDPREVNNETEKDSYRAYAYASVDAKTGKILSFNSSLKSNYDDAKQKWNSVKIAYDKEEGRKVLETFLKTQIKDRFSNSVFSEQYDDYIAGYKGETPIYGGYSYQYNRVNEGVEFPYNNINGSVDGVTGKIYSYGTYWNDNVTFESTKGAISAEEAMNYYLGKDGYDLNYEINTINKYDSSNTKNDTTDNLTVEYEVRLVYNPNIIPCYISPFTGEQLNSNGEVYTQTKPYAYKDIDNTQKNRNILLLADMNIGFDGENFLPNQNITAAELTKLLSAVGYDSSVIDTGKTDGPITREELAQLFINKLGLEKMSKLSGIYKTGYTDDSAIDSQYIGAVALAKGLGIMEADSSNYFNPKSNITRFDAVSLIMNFINVQQKGI